MINKRWEKRMLRATKTDVITRGYNSEFTFTITDNDDENSWRRLGMLACAKDHEKIMNYLQKESNSGYAHNLDMLLASLNWNQHGREAILNSLLMEEDEYYILKFPFGIKNIEFILSKNAVDAE